MSKSPIKAISQPKQDHFLLCIHYHNSIPSEDISQTNRQALLGRSERDLAYTYSLLMVTFCCSYIPCAETTI